MCPFSTSPCIALLSNHRSYTASIIQGSASLPAYGGFVQVDAKLPDAPVRFSIWLQAAGSELSVFDIDVKGGNGSYATTFNTGAHTFDSSTTLASAMETVVVEGGAAELAANFHVYGVAWCVADRSLSPNSHSSVAHSVQARAQCMAVHRWGRHL